jgi:hypothetical protein
VKVSAFTPTRGRPQSLARCREYVAQQTYPVLEHVVQEGGTLVENLIGGLPKVAGELVVIFEDDDYYPSSWVAECVRAVEAGAQAFGDHRSHYYHLSLNRYRVYLHPRRASLSTTAFKRHLIPTLIDQCCQERFIDIRFWRELNKKGAAITLRDDAAPLVVGFKGGPGLPGIGSGHSEGPYRDGLAWPDTPCRSLLATLIGRQAADRYR